MEAALKTVETILDSEIMDSLSVSIGELIANPTTSGSQVNCFLSISPRSIQLAYSFHTMPTVNC